MATFELSPEVRWSDQDLLGHVNNARMITLIEECRVRWMHELRAGHITGGGLLVARQTIDYLVPVMYGPELKMTVTVKKLGVDRGDFINEYDPGNPAADSNGMVKMPNVNILIEMADMREANRSYDANLQVIRQTRDLVASTIDLLKASQ